ncbi:copper resistance protein CopC [Novosphingobium sp. B1]|uniref:copper resistance protein CopC n=1 Tax=Novosphingobium sp. B1 TaxID=1938756 RepID=UPI0009D8618B|nr:copper resistance protein CopC [Novosphingobium sp. B1]SMD03431.1 CopC domain-containing protein [Novosphingobium sp. B1]
MRPVRATAAAFLLMLASAAALAGTPSPKLLRLDPPNGAELSSTVTEVTLEFEGKTVLTSVTLERPDGTMQPVYERAQKPFKGKLFNLALRHPADAPGTFAVHYVAWSPNMKSSTSGVWQFVRQQPVSTPEP